MLFHYTMARLRQQLSKVGTQFIVPTFISACLHLDRIGRVFDANQLLELMVTVCSYLDPFMPVVLNFLPVGLSVFEWLLKLLTGQPWVT